MECAVDIINRQIETSQEISYECHLVKYYFALNQPSIIVPKNSCYGNKDRLLKISKMVSIFLQKKPHE